MRRNLLRICLTSAFLLLLTGCFFQSADDLYSLPRAPEDFRNLQEKIDEVRRGGAEYAAPLQGRNTQPVQLLDLDGDGVQEAIAFFRVAAENQMKIYIYHQTEAENYEVQTIIVGEGASAINSISYVDLDGSPKQDDKELVVSWQFSSKVYTLAAYSVHGAQATQLMSTSTYYADYVIQDIDQDNRAEIIVLYVNSVDGENKAELHDYDSEAKTMLLRDIASLSREITDISAKLTGYLRGEAPEPPALFVTSKVTNGYVTDILAWRDSHFVNVTLNSTSGMSDITYRTVPSVGARDINGDGVLELPIPTAFPTPKGGSENNYWSTMWQQYDIDGTAWPVYNTYYNEVDGWYLILPESWEGKVTLTRKDTVISGSRAVIFSHWEGDEAVDPVPFLAIYTLSGVNKDTQAAMDGRFPLLPLEGDPYYVARFRSGGWDCGLDEDSLKENFHLIQPDLGSGTW